jgi:ribosomal-protein-alanine N-acetyltransferase
MSSSARRFTRAGSVPGAATAPVLRTPRLDLVPSAAPHLVAELDGPAALAVALGTRVPDEWPPDLYGPEAVEFSLVTVQHTPAEDLRWLFYYFVLRADEDGAPTVIGVGGYKGPPEEGEVEVGYSILDAYQRRGFASEAVGSLLAAAFADARVQSVCAETFPELVPSIGVLERCGLRLVGDGSEEGALRFAVSRTEWSHSLFVTAREGRP